MQKIQLVVFDMAGTTVADKGNVATAFMEACRMHGHDVATEDVNSVMGFRKKDAIRMLLERRMSRRKEDIEQEIENIHESFLSNMISFYQNDPDLHPLPYAESVFGTLKKQGIRVALNTGFTKGITDTILSRLGWNTNVMIDHVISSDEVPEGRPHPYMIRSIMEALGIKDAALVAKVGDTQVDIEEGRNAGCGLVISVTTGAYTREQLENFKPDHIIDTLKDVPAIIQ